MIGKYKLMAGKLAPRIGAHVLFCLATIVTFNAGHQLMTLAIVLFKWFTGSITNTPEGQ